MHSFNLYVRLIKEQMFCHTLHLGVVISEILALPFAVL